MVVELDGGVLRRNPTLSIFASRPVTAPFALLRDRDRPDRVALRLAEDGGATVPLWVNDAALTAAVTHARLGGRVAVLSSAAREVVKGCLDRLGLAADIYASDAASPMTDERRERIAIALFGLRGFHFLGPARSPLCLVAHRAVLIGGSARQCAALRTDSILATTLPRDWRMVQVPMTALSGVVMTGETVNQQVSREIWAQSGDFAKPPRSAADTIARRH